MRLDKLTQKLSEALQAAQRLILEHSQQEIDAHRLPLALVGRHDKLLLNHPY